MGRITIEQAARAVLGRDDDEEDDTPKRGVRPPRKISLPRVRWLEKPGPSWVEPPRPQSKKKPATPRRRP